MMRKRIISTAIIALIALSIFSNIYAQPPVSDAKRPGGPPPGMKKPGPFFKLSYDVYPYSSFDDPPVSAISGSEVQRVNYAIEATFPIVRDRGKTIILNQFNYRHRHIIYDDWPPAIDTDRLDHVYSFGYTFFMRRSLSQKWSLLTRVSPEIASDFENNVGIKDFNFQVGVLFVRPVSRQWTLGFGAFYSTTFGQPLPLPGFTFNWNNGSNMSAMGIMPIFMNFKYEASKFLDIGLVFRIDGDDYRGDPERYDVEDPVLRLSAINFGPFVEIQLTPSLRLNIESGYAPYNRLEFYDSDREIISYNLEGGPFVRFEIQTGYMSMF